MDKSRRDRRRLYRFGDIVRLGGIYVRAGGGKPEQAQRVALSIGERFPPALVGWHLEERLSVQRPAIDRLAMPTVPPEQRPILLDAAAMEYALERVHRGGWNGALIELEAKILANGEGPKSKAAKLAQAHLLVLIAELRIRRTIAGTKEEGDPDDG